MVNHELFSLPSEEVDRYFGYEIDKIEHNLLTSARNLRPDGTMDNFGEVLHDGHQTWVGLDPQILNTPYPELVQLCRLLKPQAGELMIDIGAGYGRLGLVLHTLYPEAHFLGYELVKERVTEGTRVFRNNQCHNARLVQQDLTDDKFILPDAKIYFLYDYGKVSHIRQTLKQIEQKTERLRFKVVARGKGSRSIIEHEHPWLCISPVHHEENFSIYSF